MDVSSPRVAVAILVPTLGRPRRIRPLIENIRAVTPQPHKIYFMTSDEESIQAVDEMGCSLIEDTEPQSYVARMNKLYQNTTEPFVFTASDDSLFHEHWLAEAMKVMDEGYSVVVPDDLFNPNGTQALIRRDYQCCIDTPDVLFYPGYFHNWSETEQFETAKKNQVFARAMKSKVEHLHWESGKAEHDSTYDRNHEKISDDYKLFNTRRQLWRVVL